jgi:hypothetical protein
MCFTSNPALIGGKLCLNPERALMGEPENKSAVDILDYLFPTAFHHTSNCLSRQPLRSVVLEIGCA